MIRWLLLALLSAALATPSAGCGVEGYCITCAEDDGGTGDDDAGDDDGGGDGDGDAGPPPDACISSGTEVCDGLDNDCNGTADDGDLPGTGTACSTDEGECVEGTLTCIDGEIVCDGGVFPAQEVCDTLDNDCNGTPDDGIPVTGCGIDTGECVAGTMQCVGGVMDCVGDLDLTGSDEECNGLDDDCDGDYDEDVTTAPIGDPCGPAQGDEGECQTGSIECIGGVPQCQGAIYPQLEKCDGDPDTVDWDCDGDFDNGFSLSTDVRNCGACGNTCLDDHDASDHVGATFCSSGTCAISQCEDDYWNNNASTGLPGYEDGCEYFCDTFSGPVEACNDADDDCDGDVDPPGELTHPEVNGRDVCDIPDTLCAGTISECVDGAWVCNWPAEVNNADGDTLPDPETDCDEVDNDCDGVADDAFPDKGADCNDGGEGICRRTGELVCNGTDDGLECGNLSPVVPPTTESCNGLDDDCLGDVDEGFTDGALSEWVDIGGGVEIFAYEASRPDSDDSTAGTMTGHVCSKPDALPWTNVTYEQAVTACGSIGARLCTEAEWERACQGLGERYTGDGSAANVIAMQAEDYHARASSSCCSGDYWAPLGVADFTGTTALMVYDDDGSSPDDTTGARLDYNVDFPVSGTWYVWIRGWAWGSGSNSVHAGLDGSIPGTADFIGNFPAGAWTWRRYRDDNTANRTTISVGSSGNHTFSIYEDDDGFVIDKIVLTTDVNYDPSTVNGGVGPEAGCAWSYGAGCETYDGDICNGDDFDTDASTPADDEDDVLPTGSMGGCYTDWGAAGQIFDMSGNVKEFADDRSDGVNPVRGGASNNTAAGISCGYDFTAVDDGFAFPNTGFRCCR